MFREGGNYLENISAEGAEAPSFELTVPATEAVIVHEESPKRTTRREKNPLDAEIVDDIPEDTIDANRGRWKEGFDSSVESVEVEVMPDDHEVPDHIPDASKGRWEEKIEGARREARESFRHDWEWDQEWQPNGKRWSVPRASEMTVDLSDNVATGSAAGGFLAGVFGFFGKAFGFLGKGIAAAASAAFTSLKVTTGAGLGLFNWIFGSDK